MIKKLVGLVLVFVLTLVGIGYIFADGPVQNSTETVIAVIGENVQMEVQNPLMVSNKWMGIAIKWEEGKSNPVFPGMTIGEGEITITNVSPINQAAYFYARAISAEGRVWPNLEVVVKSGSVVYYPYPWQQIVLAPGATINLRIEVNVSYEGSASSSFRGVELIIQAVKPQTSPECTPQGCG